MPTLTKKYLFLLALGFWIAQGTYAQLSIASGNSAYIIDFDVPTGGVLIGPYQGGGLVASPVVNNLNSNAWATTGMSDGDTDFGNDYTVGDFARGISEGNVLLGGFYSFLVGTDNSVWGFQQTSEDFSPGTITLKMVNNTGEYIEDLSVIYKIWQNNNGDFSSSFDPAYSKDNVNFIPLDRLDHITPERRDDQLSSSTSNWTTFLKDTTLRELVIAPGDYFYFRWSSDSVSAYQGYGANDRYDEIGFDEITVNALTTNNPAPLIDSTEYYRYPTSSDATTITAHVIDPNNAIAADGIVIKYGTSPGSYPNTVIMNLVSGNNYSGAIPALPDGTEVYFIIEATDEANASRSIEEQSFTVRNAATASLPYYEPFNADLGDCYVFSVRGDTKEWLHGQQAGRSYAWMSGYDSREVEEDWMILPGFDFSAGTNHAMYFQSYFNYGNDQKNDFDLMYSTDYPGTGDPSGSSWTSIDFKKPIDKVLWYFSDIVDLSVLDGESMVYLAFRYYNNFQPYREWRVDDLIVVRDFAANPEPPNHPTDFTANAINGSTIEVSWSDVVADSAITVGYTVIASTSSTNSDPIDGTPVPEDTDLEDGYAVRNIFYGFEEVSFLSALPNTTYYLKIFPYSNSGALIDYKTDDNPPTATTTTPAGSSAVAGDILFAEFMADPTSVGDDVGEWIEIFNTTDADININGWLIQSSGSDGGEKHVIKNGGPLIVPANDFFVLGLEDDTILNGGVPVDYAYSSIFMGNTFDTVAIYSDANVLINIIEWGGDGVWDILPGQSLMYVGLPGEDNNAGSNWFATLLRENGFLNITNTELGSPRTNGLYQNLVESTTWTGIGYWSEGNTVGKNNWSDGAPGRNVDVIVNGNVVVDMTTLFPAVCKKLTVNQTQGLIIPPNRALTTK